MKTLGQLLGGLVVGVSAFDLLVFPEGGADNINSLMMTFLQTTTDLSLDRVATSFQTQSEVISILAEIGVVILLFEIGQPHKAVHSLSCNMLRINRECLRGLDLRLIT